MTRSYAARRLLEHGPLTFREMVAITRWAAADVRNTLRSLKRCHHVSCVNHSQYTLWKLV